MAPLKKAPSPACVHTDIECTYQILSCPAGTPSTSSFWEHRLPVFLAALRVCQIVMLYCQRQLVFFLLNPPLFCMSLTAMLCVSEGLLHSCNPFLLSNCPLCLVLSPALRKTERPFSFCTCSLFSFKLAVEDQSLLLSHSHFYRSLTAHYYFMLPLLLPPSVIPISSSWLGT